MLTHEHWEELAALAAGGHIAEPQLREFLEHMRFCEKCQAAYREFVQLHDEDLPLLSKNSAWSALPVPKGYRDRFIMRAQESGARFSEDVRNHSASHRPELRWLFAGIRPWAIGAALAGVIVSAFVVLPRRSKESTRSIATGSATEIQQLVESASIKPELARVPNSDRAKEAEIRHLREQEAGAEQTIRDLQGQLQAAQANMQAIEASWAQLLRQSSDELAAAQKELDDARSAGTQRIASIAALQMRVTELSEQLRKERNYAQREHELLSADRDIRDLMGARNLRIVDVLDVDASGGRTKAFGRVFYTEGKALVFYAYDLSEDKIRSASTSFQVWGNKGDPSGPATRLGFLYNDHAQGRWVLKVDDPAIIDHISTVFVTVDSPKAQKPKGEKLLYAYLGIKPNHQ